MRISDWSSDVVSSDLGLDIAENRLTAARERLRDHANTALDALTRSRLDPLADASMDKGYCIAVFIHMDKEDMVLYLRDVARVQIGRASRRERVCQSV